MIMTWPILPPAGGALTFTITGMVPPAARGIITETATVGHRLAARLRPAGFGGRQTKPFPHWGRS